MGCGAAWPSVEPINVLHPVQHDLSRPTVSCGTGEGGGGVYVEEAADSADHEAGLVEARDAREGVAGGTTEEVRAEELHVGHGEELFGVKDAISLATSEV